jgi:hypothetical protein
MMRLVCWPPRVPPELEGLYEAVGARLGCDVVVAEAGGDLAGAAPGDAALVVVDAAVAPGVSIEDVLSGVGAAVESGATAICFVIGDGFLGTDDPAITAPMSAAATVAAARSVAVRRSGEVRANVVCVPGAVFGDRGEQRGPLAHTVEQVDVVEAVSFLLGPEAAYLNGQVLFVDGGRHLFSSMSA